MSVTYEQDGLSRVVVRGELDDAAADELRAIARRIAAEGPARVELDLRHVTGYTATGAAAVSAWLALCRTVNRGVGIHVATDAGRRALLACLAEV